MSDARYETLRDLLFSQFYMARGSKESVLNLMIEAQRVAGEVSFYQDVLDYEEHCFSGAPPTVRASFTYSQEHWYFLGQKEGSWPDDLADQIETCKEYLTSNTIEPFEVGEFSIELDGKGSLLLGARAFSTRRLLRLYGEAEISCLVSILKGFRR